MPKVTKASKRAARKAVPEARPPKNKRRRDGNIEEFAPGTFPPDVEPKQRPRQIVFRGQAQYNFAQMILGNQLIFGMGPAGTGKTYIPTAIAANLLNDRRVSKIVVTRPMVATESIGFLPGTEEEKCAPFFKVVRKTLEVWLGVSHVENLIKNGRIEFCALAHMRGDTFEDAFVILDEAQNTTPKQMELFLTRFGENCTMVINGDSDQCDIRGPNGLDDAVKRMRSVPNSGVFEFTSEDVIRSEMCKEIVKRYQINRNM